MPGSFNKRTDISDKIAGNGLVICFCNLFSRFLFHISTTSNLALKEFLQQVAGEMVSIHIIQLQTLFSKIVHVQGAIMIAPD
jgi:hypothetical protein